MNYIHIFYRCNLLTPAERECKEKLLNRENKEEEEKIRVGDCIEALSAA
jgi:hypothetical protein